MTGREKDRDRERERESEKEGAREQDLQRREATEFVNRLGCTPWVLVQSVEDECISVDVYTTAWEVLKDGAVWVHGDHASMGNRFLAGGSWPVMKKKRVVAPPPGIQPQDAAVRGPQPLELLSLQRALPVALLSSEHVPFGLFAFCCPQTQVAQDRRCVECDVRVDTGLLSTRRGDMAFSFLPHGLAA